MAQTIKLRRSAVAGNRPTTAQLDLGELAINTIDGKIYFEKSGSNGESIQEIFTTNATNSGSLTTIGDVTITGSLNVSGSTTQIGTNNLYGNTILSGSLVVSGSIGMNASLVSIQGPLRLDPTSDPGSQNITASFLFTSASNTDTGFDLYYRQKDNLVKFKWIEGGISSGLLYGGVITYSGTTINVSSGSGIINNLNASTGSEISPYFTYVTWPNYSMTAEYLESHQNTYIYVDSTGNVIQQPTYFTSTQYQEAIPLGRVTHANYTSITGAGSNVQTSYDSDAQQNEFIRAFGPIKVSGLNIFPHTGTTGISISSGVSYNMGGYYPQNPNHPSQYTSNAYPTASIARAYRSGSGIRLDNNGGSFYTTLDTHNWDDGTGVLNSMASGDWQIQRVFVNPTNGRTTVYYGQKTYTTFVNAYQSIAIDPFEEGEFTAKSLVFAGYVIAKGNTANLADDANNMIVQAGTFRNTQGSSGGTSAVSLFLDNLSDVNALSPTNGQSLIYESGIWVNGDVVTALTASYVDYSNIANKPTLVSGSSQLTASLDSHYIVSGSITQTTWDNIENRPEGIVSSSSQLTSSYDIRYALSGSLGSGGGVSAIYIATQGVLQGTASYFDFNGSGVNATINDGTASIQITGGGSGGGGVYNSYFAELSQSSAANTWSFFHNLGVEHPVVTIYDESNQVIQPLTIEAITTASMEIVFSSARKGYAVATIGSALPYISASYEGYSLQIVDGAPMWAESASVVATASYVEYSNVANKPTLVSGSSQLTSSYDDRYVLIGSITQTTWDNIENKPGGIISSSAQLPSGLISGSSQLPAGVVSGSSQIVGILSPLNAVSASLISRTGSYATTGSNVFVGNQTISASLFVSGTTNFNSAVAVNDSNLNLTNTASLNLTSGSSIYVANNGIISLTGSLLITGSASITGSIVATSFSGAIAANNGVISGSSQLTSSYDLRYETTGRGIVSGSSQILEGSGIWSSSAQMPEGVISGSSQLEGATFDSLTIRNLHTLYETSSVVYASGSNQFGDELTDVQILSGSVEVVGQLTLNGVSVITEIPAGTISGSSQLPSGLISGSDQLTASLDLHYIVSGTITQTTWDNIENKPNGIISGSSQLPSGLISGSSQLPEGLVSGSTQIILQNTTGQLSASRVDGLNLSQIATGSWTASVANDEFNIIHEGSDILKLTSGSTIFDNGIVTIKGNSFANGYAEGYTELGNALIVEGNEIISGSLTILGDSSHNGTTTISGSLIVSGTLNLENANIDNSRYLHVQSTGATTWTVNHNLEYDYPNITIWDATGNVIIPDSIVRVSNNQLTVGFVTNESGWAHVSVGGISTGQADRFLYTQATEETTWTINHGLNYKYVNVNVYDDNDEMLLPQTITATNANTLTLTFAIPTSGNAIISKGGARTTSAFTEFGNGTYGLSGSLNLTGSIVVSGDVDAENFNTTSDVRLKTNLEVIEGALDKVEQLNAYTYDWIDEYNNNGIRQIGLVSQEVQKVQPELVHEKDIVVGDRMERMLLLDYSKVTTLLIGAVKELSEKVKQLENKIGE